MIHSPHESNFAHDLHLIPPFLLLLSITTALAQFLSPLTIPPHNPRIQRVWTTRAGPLLALGKAASAPGIAAAATSPVIGVGVVDADAFVDRERERLDGTVGFGLSGGLGLGLGLGRGVREGGCKESGEDSDDEGGAHDGAGVEIYQSE